MAIKQPQDHRTAPAKKPAGPVTFTVDDVTYTMPSLTDALRDGRVKMGEYRKALDGGEVGVVQYGFRLLEELADPDTLEAFDSLPLLEAAPIFNDWFTVTGSMGVSVPES